MDRIDRATRSRLMASVRSKNTAPELVIRRLAHRLGYRFRIHRRDLPGTPDLVFPKYRTALQVHGCFWHGHEGCRHAALPRSNVTFWREKIDATRRRDLRAAEGLAAAGWNVLTVWECETRDEEALISKLRTGMPPGNGFDPDHPDHARSQLDNSQGGKIEAYDHPIRLYKSDASRFKYLADG